ncbi:hypothetical protein QYE76_036810 [Lolium multiflorum]|uniref:Reverse transcriptase Ty1/copia-type domain-containing protein n=2 Tax=Lolium TaxID=4520 RepID=A0AAD8R3I7_LOLMU|nr:hypothetical protein QYE76_036810 [Lolium multiflorum]
MIVDDNDEDPATYEEAMMSPDSNKWQEAMKSEMGSMYDNQVWTLVDLPDSRKAVENKWIFKRKTNADGNITVYKARLVAKGFRQIQGVDYDETFSPVAKLKSVRILLAIAAFFDYEIWQMDVKTAFLNGDIEEELYMVQPNGFFDPKNADKCVVAKSSTESEYIVASEASSEAIWMKRFITELGVVPSALDPLTIYCDNMGAIANAQEPRSHKKLKHIKMRFHVIRERSLHFLLHHHHHAVVLGFEEKLPHLLPWNGEREDFIDTVRATEYGSAAGLQHRDDRLHQQRDLISAFWVGTHLVGVDGPVGEELREHGAEEAEEGTRGAGGDVVPDEEGEEHVAADAGPDCCSSLRPTSTSRTKLQHHLTTRAHEQPRAHARCRRLSGSSDRRCVWQRKRMRGILWIHPVDYEHRRRSRQNQMLGGKRDPFHLCSLLVGFWLVEGRGRKAGRRCGRKAAGEGGAEQAARARRAPSWRTMDQISSATTTPHPRAKATLVLGAESFAVSSESGTLSEQLAAMREKSMVILKDYITRHNAPNDVPDEPVEGLSDDEGEALAKNPPKKSKKQK